MYVANPKITGYHGTYPENAESIIINNFKETENHDVWLGDGVYFFVDGIGALPPHEYAAMWAIDQAKAKNLGQTHYTVLEVVMKINPDKLLDLTDIKGKLLFNEFRQRAIEKIEQSGKISVKQYKDTDVLNVMQSAIGIEFVKSDIYIKFAAQRTYRFASIQPNVTVLNVRNPLKNIQRLAIKELKKGEIL